LTSLFVTLLTIFITTNTFVIGIKELSLSASLTILSLGAVASRAESIDHWGAVSASTGCGVFDKLTLLTRGVFGNTYSIQEIGILFFTHAKSSIRIRSGVWRTDNSLFLLLPNTGFVINRVVSRLLVTSYASIDGALHAADVAGLTFSGCCKEETCKT
jgi:hypothetical protein